MISLLEIAQSMNEADEDRYVHVGGGVYKEKDGKGEPLFNSPKYLKKDDGGFEMVDDDDPRLKKGDDSDKEKEKPSGKKLGGGDFDRDMGDDTKDDNAESDDVEISDANSGPIDREDIMDMLKNDPEIMDKIGTGDDDDLYWDGMDLVSSKFDDATIASIDDDSNMTLGDLKKQIMDYEEDMDETKVNNGKKYRAIKEEKKSKKHKLQETYERIANRMVT